jgi:hypothetical protein
MGALVDLAERLLTARSAEPLVVEELGEDLATEEMVVRR